MRLSDYHGRLISIKVMPTRCLPHEGKFHYVIAVNQGVLRLKVTQYTPQMRRVSQSISLTTDDTAQLESLLHCQLPLQSTFLPTCDDGRGIEMRIGHSCFEWQEVPPPEWTPLLRIFEWVEQVAWARIEPLNQD